jgi:hypothetical protein
MVHCYLMTIGRLGAIALIGALTGCGGSAAEDPDSAPPIEQTGTIATGELEVPAATSFEEPGFHLAFERTHVVPDDLAPPAGAKLVVRMWDSTRPDQTCSQEHPLSGCATVDWSDAIGRPNVPDTGVFDNRVTVEDASGSRDFFLTEARGLADTPDPYVPS